MDQLFFSPKYPKALGFPLYLPHNTLDSYRDSTLLGCKSSSAEGNLYDNETNFVGIEKELLGRTSVDQQRIKSKMSQNRLHWKFNHRALSMHHGGAWERLVQSSKRLFFRILGNRRLTDEEVLLLVFCLVEQFLNVRPLVSASSDVIDLEA